MEPQLISISFAGMESTEHHSAGKLITIITRQINTYLQRTLQPFGIGPGQVSVLKYILENDGTTSKAIVEYFSLDKGSVSSLLGGLQSNGYIIREVSGKDGRVSNIYASSKARAIFPDIVSIYEGITTILLTGFKTDERTRAFDMLGRMFDNFAAFLDEKAQ